MRATKAARSCLGSAGKCTAQVPLETVERAVERAHRRRVESTWEMRDPFLSSYLKDRRRETESVSNVPREAGYGIPPLVERSQFN